MTEMEETSCRHQKIQRGLELPANWRAQRTRLGPVVQLAHGGNQGKPVGNVHIAQSAGSFLEIGFEMVKRHAVLGMAFARNLSQPLEQDLRLLHHQLRNHFVVELAEYIA